MSRNDLQRKFIIKLIILAILATTILVVAYIPGITGSLFYDDFANLSRLSELRTTKEKINFILSGFAGPLGRPISLATFVLQKNYWPEMPEILILTNIAIHIANTFLIFTLSFLIIRHFVSNKNHCTYLAFTAAILWSTLPIIASTNLIVIQRMTSLSAFFALMALITQAYFHEVKTTSRLIIYFTLFTSFYTLSILSKESGALIPIFAILVDKIISNSSNKITKPNDIYSKIKKNIHYIYLVFILYYLSPLNIDWFTFSEARGYSPWERLQSQSIIIIEYLKLTFIPSPTSFSPFHDDIEVTKSIPTIILNALSILTILFISIIFRKKTIWPLFAILWFLTGHLIESTTINLELYFEHRNYLAVYGFTLMIVMLAYYTCGKLRKILFVSISAYISLNFLILFTLTNLWGNPYEAAFTWAVSKPNSSRASLHFASLKTTPNIGGNRIEMDSLDFFSKREAIQILDLTASNCKKCLDVSIQALIYACSNNQSDVTNRLEHIYENSEFGNINTSVIDGLFVIRELVNNQCDNINSETIYKLTLKLINSTRYKTHTNKVKLEFIAAMLANDINNEELVYYHLNLAENLAPLALPVLEFQIHKHLESGEKNLALEAINRRIVKLNNQDNNHIEIHNSLLNLMKTTLDSN